tara:strand:+ start:3007 stop:3447 length:441 start_codon:yes stop_codon:yes gene_type:complete
MNNIKHFKLTNGEEIVCDVVEWPDPDTDSVDLVIRQAFRIISAAQSSTENVFYYALKPWMVYQEGDDLYQILNYNHIIAEATPTTELLKHYVRVTRDEDTSHEEVEHKMKEYLDELKGIISGLDSADRNAAADPKVIKFPSKNKLH